jgi:hypothetical protein
VTVEIIPDEVKRLGLDAFERIGEESSTTTELSVVTIVEGVVVRKNEGLDHGNRGALVEKAAGRSEGDLFVVSQAQLIDEGVVEVDQFAQFEAASNDEPGD